MAENKKTAASLNNLTYQILMVFQNPTIFRWTVVMAITAMGLGGFGVPLYFRIQRAHSDFSIQKTRNDLIGARSVIDSAATEYKSHVSKNTEYIEWLSDLRDLTREMDLTADNMMPVVTTAGGTLPLYQKLFIKAEITGSHANLMRFLGTLEKQQIRVNVTEWRMNAVSDQPNSSVYRLSLNMAMFMSMPTQKKKAAAQSAPQKQEQTVKTVKTGKFRAVEEEGIVAPPVAPEKPAQAPDKASKDKKSDTKPATQEKKQGKFSLEDDTAPSGTQPGTAQPGQKEQQPSGKTDAGH